MPPITQPYIYVQPPAVERYRHGLLDVAQEITVGAADDPHWAYGGIEFDSWTGVPTATYPSGLNTQNGSGGIKALTACPTRSRASAFTVYGGIAAGSVGHVGEPNTYWQNRARGIVELSGQHAAETALWTGSAGAAPALNDAATPSAITGQANTTGGAVDMVTGLAVLEAYLADHYAARGIIHAPRAAAPYLALLHQVCSDPANDNVLATRLGTKFAFGGGYDGTGPGAAIPPPPAAGIRYFWIYATGQVAYLRSEIDTPASFGEALDRATNQVVALLAEQQWLVAVDTVAVAVLVKSPTVN